MSELVHVLEPSFDRGPQESQGNSATRYYAECPNHKAMLRPSKTDCHWPYGITHPSMDKYAELCVITFPCPKLNYHLSIPNFNSAAVWEWICKLISRFIMDMITYPYWD